MIWLRRATRLLPVFPLIIFCLSCSDFWVSESSTQSISVTPTSMILKAASSSTAGDKESITATALTVGGANQDVTSTANWSSDNSAITVSKGTVTVVGTSGNVGVNVTASEGGQSATCSILTYTGAAPTALTVTYPTTINPASVSTGVYAFVAKATINGITNQVITPYVTWGSSNTSAATVNSKGQVTVLTTAVAGTTFTITATANVSGSSVTGTSNTYTVI